MNKEQEEAHYFFTLMEFAKLCVEYGLGQVLNDLDKYQKISLIESSMLDEKC